MNKDLKWAASFLLEACNIPAGPNYLQAFENPSANQQWIYSLLRKAAPQLGSMTKELNKKYRSKNKPTNVLSFGYSKNSGELVLCKEVIKKEIEKFGRTFDELLLFLVIHGMLHLKGMQHGSTMERKEKLFLKKFVRA